MGDAEIGEVDEEEESADFVQGLGGQDYSVAPRRMPLLRELRDLIAPFAIFARAQDAGGLSKCTNENFNFIY